MHFLKILLIHFTFLFTLIGHTQPLINSVVPNATSIGKYSKFELDVKLSAAFKNAYDYSNVNLQAVFTAPSGLIYTIDGFRYQDCKDSSGSVVPTGSPSWKIRYTPCETGAWTYIVTLRDSTGQTSSPSGNFSVVTSSLSGFIHPAANNMMRLDDGTSWFAVGENMAWDQPPYLHAYSHWIDSLSAAGGNYIRIWMAGWSFAIEWSPGKIGHYASRQTEAWMLDSVISLCSRKNIRVQLCQENFSHFSRTNHPAWSQNPYYDSLGGPCANPGDFFKDTIAKKYFKNRMRYVIARWGYTPNILSWELFNEVDYVDQFTSNEDTIVFWHKEMAAYIRSIDVNKHPVTTSYGQNFREPKTWKLGPIDYTQLHDYPALPADLPGVNCTETETYLTHYSKPVIVGEFGVDTSDYAGIDFHNSLWASAFSGSFGCASTWGWNYYVASHHLYRELTPVAGFMSAVDLYSEPLSPITPNSTSQKQTTQIVVPGDGAFHKASSDSFTIYNNNTVVPNVSGMSKFLFAPGSPALRCPPLFTVNYSQAGQFKVVTSASSSFNSPVLLIQLDGVTLLNQSADTSTTYTINVPAGSHSIFVDNRGNDWICVARYVFTNYTTQTRCYALMGTTHAEGWIQNMEYNFNTITHNGLPSPDSTATVSISGLANNGSYQVQWFDCSNNVQIGTNALNATAGNLVLNVPVLAHDIAFKLSYSGPASVHEYVPGMNVHVFPNPFSSLATVEVIGDHPDGYDFILSDQTGREVIRRFENSNYFELERKNLNSGMYFYTVLIRGEQKTPWHGKIIIQ